MSKFLINRLKKIAASTEEIDIILSSDLKISINSSRKAVESIGRENLVGLQPDDEETFQALVCEQENFRGRFNICKDPVHSVLVDKGDSDHWKLIYCRKICDKVRKAGVCRRALVKISYIS